MVDVQGRLESPNPDRPSDGVLNIKFSALPAKFDRPSSS